MYEVQSGFIIWSILFVFLVGFLLGFWVGKLFFWRPK